MTYFRKQYALNFYSRQQIATLLPGLLWFCATGLARRTVSGKITDAATGEGLIRATVRIKGSSRGAIADIDGNYAIVNLLKDATMIVITFSG